MMHGRRVSRFAEMGGPTNLEPIIDQQEGPTCGFEAVENAIQLFRPVGNQLSRGDLIRRAHAYGALRQDATGRSLDVSGYDKILWDYGISATWQGFDHTLLIEAVWTDRVAIAVVDGYQLDPGAYPEPASWHAVLVTNIVTDLSHSTALAYVGIDSNFAGRQRVWSLDRLERATNAYGAVNLLITRDPTLWPHRSEHYVKLPNSRIVLAK